MANKRPLSSASSVAALSLAKQQHFKLPQMIQRKQTNHDDKQTCISSSSSSSSPLSPSSLPTTSTIRTLFVIMQAMTFAHAIDIRNSSYHNIIIDIDETVPSSLCRQILENFEMSMTSASQHLQIALDGRANFGSFTINLPATWPDTCMPPPSSSPSSPQSSSSVRNYDFLPPPPPPQLEPQPQNNSPPPRGEQQFFDQQQHQHHQHSHLHLHHSHQQDQQQQKNQQDRRQQQQQQQFAGANCAGGAVGVGAKSDITITSQISPFGQAIWTQQSAGCGAQGEQIFIPYQRLASSKTTFTGKEFVREWAKYRYGVFDEIGFYDDPIYPRCYFTDSMHVTGCSDAAIKDTGICYNTKPFADTIRAVHKKSKSSLMFEPRPSNVERFCNNQTHNRYAPTKHNLMCNRQSIEDVILSHQDFAANNQRGNDVATTDDNCTDACADEGSNQIFDIIAQNSTKFDPRHHPSFNYNRRQLTRYIIIIDETQDILIRESWNFLRNALRKWFLYDIKANSEIGIVLADGQKSTKMLDLKSLMESGNRDVIASFIPYTPNDSRETICIHCAIADAARMFEQRQNLTGIVASNVVVVIAPGMDYETSIDDIAMNVNNYNLRIATINYPEIVRRKPLDELATTDGGGGGLAFTVIEKKFNSEKSLLHTYIELTQILTFIGNEYFEGPIYHLPIDIHRRELNVESSTSSFPSSSSSNVKRATQLFRGEFHLDESLVGDGGGFYIYTHNGETPLIQNATLKSPSGIVYHTRSDQRMPVKQLTLLTNLNETGRWQYAIERFNGNPQSHFVQVTAQSRSFDALTIRARVWIKRPQQPMQPFIVYCEIKRGAQIPVRDAKVTVIVRRPNDQTCSIQKMMNCNNTFEYDLFDSGAGDPDITKGDGIYTRYIPAPIVAGIYSFEFVANDNEMRAFSSLMLLEKNVGNDSGSGGSDGGSGVIDGESTPLQCCGSRVYGSDANDNKNVDSSGGAKSKSKSTTTATATTTDNSLRFNRQTLPFERYFPIITLHIANDDVIFLTPPPPGKANQPGNNENVDVAGEEVVGVDVFSGVDDDDDSKNNRTIYLPTLMPPTPSPSSSSNQPKHQPYGRIGDLIATYIADNKIHLQWTSPDMGGNNVVRYEIKYSFTIHDIIDRYDTAAIMWPHEMPYTNAIGAIEKFHIDIDREPQLYGQGVFFAIKPFDELARNANGGQISNIVRSYIPQKINHSIAADNHRSTSIDHHKWNGINDNGTWNNNEISNNSDHDDDNDDDGGGGINRMQSNKTNPSSTKSSFGNGSGGDRKSIIFVLMAFLLVISMAFAILIARRGTHRRNTHRRRNFREICMMLSSESSSSPTHPTISLGLTKNAGGGGGGGGMGGGGGAIITAQTMPKPTTPPIADHQFTSRQQQHHMTRSTIDGFIDGLENSITQYQQQQQQHLYQQHHYQQNQQQFKQMHPSSTTSTNFIQNYATLDKPDHHTVGIPIYSDDADIQKKRLSTTDSFANAFGGGGVGNGIQNAIHNHDYFLDEINQGNQQQQQQQHLMKFDQRSFDGNGTNIYYGSTGTTTAPAPAIQSTITHHQLPLLQSFDTWNHQHHQHHLPPPPPPPPSSSSSSHHHPHQQQHHHHPHHHNPLSNLHQLSINGPTPAAPPSDGKLMNQVNLSLSMAATASVSSISRNLDDLNDNDDRDDGGDVDVDDERDVVPPVPPLPYAPDIYQQYQYLAPHIYDTTSSNSSSAGGILSPQQLLHQQQHHFHHNHHHHHNQNQHQQLQQQQQQAAAANNATYSTILRTNHQLHSMHLSSNAITGNNNSNIGDNISNTSNTNSNNNNNTVNNNNNSGYSTDKRRRNATMV